MHLNIINRKSVEKFNKRKDVVSTAKKLGSSSFCAREQVRYKKKGREATAIIRCSILRTCFFFMRIQRDYESYGFSLMARARRICKYNTTRILQSTLDIKIYETIHSLLAKDSDRMEPNVARLYEFERSLCLIFPCIPFLSRIYPGYRHGSLFRSLPFTRARCSLKYIARFRLIPWLCSSARNSLCMRMPRS